MMKLQMLQQLILWGTDMCWWQPDGSNLPWLKRHWSWAKRSTEEQSRWQRIDLEIYTWWNFIENGFFLTVIENIVGSDYLKDFLVNFARLYPILKFQAMGCDFTWCISRTFNMFCDLIISLTLTYPSHSKPKISSKSVDENWTTKRKKEFRVK